MNEEFLNDQWQKYQVHQRVQDVCYYNWGVVKSISTLGIYRSIAAWLNHTVCTANLGIHKFITFADKITLLFICKVRNNKKTATKMEEWCKELKKDKYLSCPSFSTQYFNKKGVPISFYLGERIEDEPPKSYILTTWSEQNFITQLEGQQQKKSAETCCWWFWCEFLPPCFLFFCLYIIFCQGNFLRSCHEQTQHLFHHVQPQISGPEKRHLFARKEPNLQIIQFKDRATGERWRRERASITSSNAGLPKANPM